MVQEFSDQPFAFNRATASVRSAIRHRAFVKHGWPIGMPIFPVNTCSNMLANLMGAVVVAPIDFEDCELSQKAFQLLPDLISKPAVLVDRWFRRRKVCL